MKILYFLFVLILLNSTCRAQFLDELSVKLHEPSELKKDVWRAQNILESENPNLYLYISKKELNRKFDSLRNTINQPLTSIGLYIKLLGLISYIGDGHLTVNLDFSKLTAGDIALLKTPRLQHPIYQFHYRILADRLFILKNISVDNTIPEGTEILSINDMPVAKLIDTLSQYITSDGYNTTYKQFLMNAGLFAERYRFLYPKDKSLKFKLRSKKGIQLLTLNAVEKSSYDSSTVAAIPTTAYKLLSPDSNIAYIQLHSFFVGDKFTGYHKIFADIKKRAMKTLIIDLRGNMGGETSWASSIFSFLIDTPTYFYRLPAEITQQKLLFNNSKVRNWVKSVSKLKYPYPIVTPDTNIFKGKIYVLINGGSFSATSLLAANLHKLNNVTFVGEETGGSKNIWTAGVIKHTTLPASKLLLSYGVVPAYFGDISKIDGRGIMPDIPIVYTIEDYLAKKDLELEWVLRDIARRP